MLEKKKIIPPQAENRFFAFRLKTRHSYFRDHHGSSVGRKLFQVTFSEQQHPYPATVSPSRFHTHPG